MLKWVPLLFLIIIGTSALAQPFKVFTAPKEVLFLALNADSNYYVCADENHVYLVELSTQKLLNKWQYNFSAAPVYMWKDNPAEFYLHPANPHQLITRVHPSNLYSPGFENPNDSIYSWNILSGKKTAALGGNVHIASSVLLDTFMAAINRYSTFKGYNDQIMHGFLGGEFGNTLGKTSQYEGGILFLTANKSYSLAAAIHYNYEKKPHPYSIQLINPSTLELVHEISGLERLPRSVNFSPTGRYLTFVATHDDPEADFVAVIDVASKEEVFRLKAVKETAFRGAKHIRISPGEKYVAFLRDNMIEVYNLATGRLERQVWATLTSASGFNGFEFVTDDKILCFGQKRLPNGLSSREGFAEVADLEELRVYTNTSAPEGTKTQLYDPAEVRIMANDQQIKSEHIIFSSNNSRFVLVGNNSFELWDSRQRRKLSSQAFEKGIKVFPDATGNTLLVLEDKHQHSYSGFTIHLIQADSGTMVSREVLPEYGEFSNAYNTRCIAVPGKTAEWLCTDDNSLWGFSAEEGTFKKFTETEGEELVQLAYAQPGKLFAVAKKGERFQLFRINSESGESTKIAASGEAIFISQSENDETYYFDNASKKVHKVEGDKSTAFYSAPDKAEIISVAPEGNHLLLQLDGSGDDSCLVIALPSGKILASFKTDFSDHHALSGNEILRLKDGFFSSFSTHIMPPRPWSYRATQLFDRTDFTVSEDNRYLLLDHDLFDLTTGGHQKLPLTLGHRTLLNMNGQNHILEDKDTGEYSDKQFVQRIYNIKTKEEILRGKVQKQVPMTYNSSPYNISPNGKFMLHYSGERFGSKFTLTLYNTQTLEKVKLPSGYDAVNFTPDPGELVMYRTTYKETEIAFFTIKGSNGRYSVSGPVKKVHKLYSSAFGGNSRELLEISSQGVSLYDISGEGPKEIGSYFGREYLSTVAYDKQRQVIIAGTDAGNLIFWDRNKPGSPQGKVRAGQRKIERLLIRGRKLYSLTGDSEVRIFDLDSLQGGYVALRLGNFGLHQNDFSWSTHDGYYWSDKSMLRFMHFVKSGEIYPVTAFDLYLNRPDVILQRMKGDATTTGLYRDAWEKRVKRSGLDPAKLALNYHQPQVQVLNRQQVNYTANSRQLKLNISAKDSLYKLRQLHVLVNEVPVFGSNGLGNSGKNEWKQEVVLNLSEGLNTIQVFAVNEKGNESREDILEVLYSPAEKSSQKVYYVGIGVSEYVDSAQNLRFAAKDVRDLVEHFRNEYKEKLVVDTLLNGAATKQNILALKEKLLKTSVDDIVIVSFSGHGLLDEQKNFYFATPDINFKQPAQNGLSYVQMEWLLDSIPARKKLMLVDACHSGEVDPEAKITGIQPAAGVKAYAPRAIQLENTQQGQSVGLQNSFRLMQQLFSDLNRGNGATVISAAGGREYAFEDEKWGNGVFTYSFIRGMNELGYDTWKGSQEVKISDLRRYIYEEVTRLTNGRQSPTTRREAVTHDWGL